MLQCSEIPEETFCVLINVLSRDYKDSADKLYVQ
jgi:hypothetical protein